MREIGGMKTDAFDYAKTTFGDRVTSYQRSRPGYPQEMINALCEAIDLKAGSKVIDLAAGTGKLGIAFQAKGMQVTYVEPSGPMREVCEVFAQKLAGIGPGSKVLCGVSDQIPVSENFADLVVVGDAAHWFIAMAEQTRTELDRVLKPGGQVAIFTHAPNREYSLNQQLHEVMVEYCDDYDPKRMFIKAYPDGIDPNSVPEHFIDDSKRKIRTATGMQHFNLERFIDFVQTFSAAPIDVRNSRLHQPLIDLFDRNKNDRGIVSFKWDVSMYYGHPKLPKHANRNDLAGSYNL